MSEAKKDLFAVLADESYLAQARQVFSGLYHHGGWQGDVMLLAHGDIPETELKWFRERGILIYPCEPLFQGEPGGMSPVLTSKFYLFKPEFRKWRTIIYCDADCVIRSSFDGLLGLPGFNAVPDYSPTLRLNMIRKESIQSRGHDLRKVRQLKKEIRRNYNVNRKAFCAGFFAFHSDIIDDLLFGKLVYLMERYGYISQFGDQLVFNLAFYRKWRPASSIYNFLVALGQYNRWKIPLQRIKAVNIHVCTDHKPWLRDNFFYGEWKDNYDRAPRVDFNRRIPGRVWTRSEIRSVTRYLALRYFFCGAIIKPYYFIKDLVELVPPLKAFMEFVGLIRKVPEFRSIRTEVGSDSSELGLG